MKYYLIAGEASGDLHGANLIKGLIKSDPQAEFRFWGGDRMADEAGTENLVKHYAQTSFFGFLEVIKNLRTILGQFKECREDIRKWNPDVLILIDYPGFNFRMAKFAHSIGITTLYYISPKVWAWKESRVKLIRKYVDRLFVIFPFEIEYFRERGIEAVYEGNPIMDVIASEKSELPDRYHFFSSNGIPDDKPLIALLAGSRRSEIDHNLPFMVELSRRFPEFRFVVAGVGWLDPRLYASYLEGSEVMLVTAQTYPLLSYSCGAVVTSGTATLETALMGIPEVVCYRGDAFSIAIGRLLVKSKYISLVNLILGREAVRELIQQDMKLDLAEAELRRVLPGGSENQRIREDYTELARLVGESGASDRFAARMVEYLKNKNADKS